MMREKQWQSYLLNNGNVNNIWTSLPSTQICKAEKLRRSMVVRQSNIQLTCCSHRRNSVKIRLRCSLLNCDYTLLVLQQVATND